MHGALTEETIRDQIRRFYAQAQVDPLLGPVFAAAITDWEPHLQVIGDFWIATLLGLRRYQGNALAAHARHPLTPAMFTRWLALWGETADAGFEAEPAQALKDRAAMIGRSLQAGLFFRLDGPAA